MKQAVLSLSGGMDSSTLLIHLLAEGYQVTAIGFDYGQKHRLELDRAKKLVKYLQKKELPVTHQIIKLDGLSTLLNSSLVEGGPEVPEGHYEQENMKETVVPNRNKIFASITQAIALSIANETKENVIIGLGIHAGDHAVYLDCRQEFRDADFEAFRIGNDNSESVLIYTPYLLVNKFDILKDGKEACKKLKISFNQVYKNTNTSYKPIKIDKKWYSDYKSAASVERIEAFIKLKKKDPVAYANIEDGPVEWEVAKEHVLKVLEDYKNKSLAEV